MKNESAPIETPNDSMPIDILNTVGVAEQHPDCEACGYPLNGQPIKADPVYGLNLIRCPECGSVRTLAPRRDARRGFLGWRFPFRFALAGVLLVGLTGFSGGLAQSTGFAASAPLARTIAHDFAAGSNLFARVDTAWWESNRDSVLASVQANGIGFDLAVLSDLLWILVVVPPTAIAVAMFLPVLRTRWLVIIAIRTQLIATAGFAMYSLDTNAVFGFEYAVSLAEWEGGWWYAALTLVVSWAITAGAFASARPVARTILERINKGPIRTGQLSKLWFPSTTAE